MVGVIHSWVNKINLKINKFNQSVLNMINSKKIKMTGWRINKFNLTWEWWSSINDMLEIIVDPLNVGVFVEDEHQIDHNDTTHIHKLLEFLKWTIVYVQYLLHEQSGIALHSLVEEII